jgi:hypothetical protein
MARTKKAAVKQREAAKAAKKKTDTEPPKPAPSRKRTQSDAAILLPAAKRQSKEISLPGTVKIYAVMRDTIRTAKGDYYQDDDATETIELYSSLQDANTRVQVEWEEWNGETSDYEEHDFDFTSEGMHLWYMGDSVDNDTEGTRVYVMERHVKAPDSEPLRIWKRPLPGEESSDEKDSDEEENGEEE